MAHSNRQKSPSKVPKFGINSILDHSENDKIFQVLQEMFHGKVEPEVVHMILTEMDWKVDKAIDTLMTFCGEGGNIDRKKNRLHKMAQEILCKKNDESTDVRSALQQCEARHELASPKSHVTLPSKSHDEEMPPLSKSTVLSDHAIASNSATSAVGLERRRAPPASSSPLQQIRSVMASTYGRTQEVKDKGHTEEQPTINPLSVDDDVHTDSNLISQSILSGALHLSGSDVLSELYNPFSDATVKESDLYQDSYKAYMDNYWPDITAKFGIKATKDMAQSKEINHQSQRDATNIFPGMYTEGDEKRKNVVPQSNGVQSSSEEKESEKMLKEKVKGEGNFPRTGIGSHGSSNISMLVRLGLAEKNERGQFKNLQKDPEEDLDLNFNMDTFDLENDDSSSDGSSLSQSGSAETMTAELKNMLGISKEEKKEPSMLESAARELERLNALSPNAKEFIPRSTNVQCNTSDSKPFDAFPKFLTPKAALPTQQRTIPPYAMFPPQQQGQHPQIRPVPMFPVPRHIPFNPQIPVVPVTLVGVRNVPPQPPPPMNIMPQTSQVGPVIQTTNMMHHPSSTLRPPPGLLPISSPTRNILHHPMSSPSPPILPYASAFPSPTAQQLASEAQQYATIAAQQMKKNVQAQSKESSPSPERSLDLCSQKVKDKIISGVRVLIILRGLPGSGKSTLARELKGNGDIFSADDYFMNGDVYCYDQRKLTDAHDHCRRKALEAVRKDVSPVIIDNTNTQVWEMCPYVDIAKSVNPEYEIEILEPSTPWRFKARQCSEKSNHAVPYESIKRMLDRYQRNVTVDMLINTKSRSRPVNLLPQNSTQETETTETKKAKKSSAETKNNSALSNVDDEDIWQDVGSFKWKNYYQPLMNEQDEEKEENEDLKDEEFPALKSNDKRNSQVENKSSKHTERKDKTRLETKENMLQEGEGGSENGNTVVADNSNVTDKIDERAIVSTVSMSSESLVKNNMLPFSTGLGFQMKKHKALSTASLQKQIELISQQKLLVSEKTCASPVTVQPEQSDNTPIENRSSRTPSFEKGRSEDKEFSDEIHELVDSLMSEHVEDKTLSDLSKVQDELKAYLHIMPIDEQQRQDAECLIDQKLSMFLHSDKTSDMQHVQDVQVPLNSVDKHHDAEDEKVPGDTNLPNNSSVTGIVDGRFDIEHSFPSELNSVEDNQNRTVSVTDEDQTIGSIELSLEKVFDVIDEKPERESENLYISQEVDLKVNKSRTVVENEIWSADQLKGHGHNKNWGNNGKTEQADEAQGSYDQKELHMKSFEKEYWDSKGSVNSTKSPVNLEEKRENHIDSVIEKVNDLSDDLGEKFWNVDSDGEKDTEKIYWKTEKPSEEQDKQVKSSDKLDSQIKSSNESDTQLKSFDKSDSVLKSSNKLDSASKIESKDGKSEKVGSPSVWEEPKSKRQRKRNNRDKNKQGDNVNSNQNTVLNEAIQSKQNKEPASEVSSKASVKNNENQQTELSSKATVKSGENQQKSKTRKNKTSKTSGQIKEPVSLKKSSQFKQVPSTKTCDTNSPDQSDSSLANQNSSSKSNSSKTHDNHQSINSSENSKHKAATGNDLKDTSYKSVDRNQKRNQSVMSDTLKNEKSDEKSNLKPSVCLSDAISVDKPSFLVQHFNDRLDGECTVLNTTSLLSLKKGKVELTIDSHMVQSRLDDGNFKQKQQSDENKTDLSSMTLDKRHDNYSDVNNSAKHTFITKENLNPEFLNTQPDIVSTDSENILQENPSTVACSNTINLEKHSKQDSQPTVTLTDHNHSSITKGEGEKTKDKGSETSQLEPALLLGSDRQQALINRNGEMSSAADINDTKPNQEVEILDKGNDECSRNDVEEFYNNDLHKKDKNAELVTAPDIEAVAMEANQQIKSEEGNDKSPRQDIAKVSTEVQDSQQDVSELNSRKQEEIKITQTPVSQDTGEADEKSGTKKKKKTSNKRKMAAKFPDKFLDDSVKEAFLNNDWATQMPKLEGSAPISSLDLETKPCIRKMDASTSITSIDTKVLNLINTGNMHILQKIEYPYQICIGRELSIMKGTPKYDPDGSIERGIPEVLHQEKSTMTDSMCVVGLEFLQSSFPSIPEKELKDILEKCDGDVEWAVNLLLDWKYNLNLSEEDSDKFVDCMFKAQHIPKSPSIHSALRQKSMKNVVSPKTLMDMCNDIIKEHNMDRHEIEQLLITSSEKRLSSLEKQLSIKAKQYSFSSFGDEVIEEDSEFTDALLKELINSADNKSLSSDSRESSHVSLLDDSVQVSSEGLNTNDANEFWNVDFDLDAKKKTQNKELENVHFDLDVGGMDIDDEEGVPESEVMINRPDDSRIDRDRTDSFGEPTVLLPLKKEFTKALFSLFGPVDGLDTDKEDDLAIPVTLDVAKLMYTCIKTASRKGQVRVHSDQQLMEDEAYARQLQAEEDSEINHHENRLTGPVNSTPQSFSKPPPPVIGFSIDRGLNLSSPRPKVVSLLDIMVEEQVKEIEKKELVETLQQSGSFSALSTRLKQQKLYYVFPGIDTTVLDDIFQANCFILEDTIKAVQGSLACNAGTPKTVMSKAAEENYEKHLIEAAKQQSLQEMLDSCLHAVHVPKVIKDAKTVNASVDYEEFRGEANLHYRLRHECFQKAQEAHRRGMRQVASFYSEQGHLHTQKIKDANMRASEQILSTRIDMLEKNSTLDLHGLHVDEAVAALEKILPNKQFELQSNPLRQKQYLIIVTGRGTHSRGGVSKLKPAVMNYLRRNEYRFSEIHEGALRVSLKHRNNT
ncbi:uncharacterized protein LOC127726317 isoform X2 [Mytilus californianus]|uniref:uncharacterized protein LOC127726317 isoform X2 n=1 Tax=Mytilus californianus TaxID=6549 RepID=UPI00224633E4|nr:uncharacterized protein LOC127726317 isoform X2 [Mytilus californianus]